MSTSTESHQMKAERSPVNLANVGLNRCPTQALMGCVSMAAIKSIEPSLKLNEIDRFLKADLADTFHQIIHFDFIDHALMRAIDGLNRHSHAFLHRSALSCNEAKP